MQPAEGASPSGEGVGPAVHEKRTIPAAWDPGLPEGRAAGVCVTAPARPVPAKPFEAIAGSGASWVAIIPYGFSRAGQPGVQFDHPRQWWGERSEGTVDQIRFARSQGLHVMLKPHIWVMGQGWLGDFDLAEDADWALWEADYRRYLLQFARLGDSLGVEMLCIGTEARMAVRRRPEFWHSLIRDIRGVYGGKLTYAANWDNMEQVPFWDALDFIGVDAYFPLSTAQTPALETLLHAWTKPKAQLQALSERHGKPILFTEYGYLSVDGCAGKHWELEARRSALTYNAQAQANAYEALYRSFWAEPWFRGGFAWKWFLTEGAGGEGDRDYTPQGKPALDHMRHWYTAPE